MFERPAKGAGDGARALSKRRRTASFACFTDGARRAVAAAQDEARSLRNGSVGSEHLLLGLLDAEPSVSGRVFRRLGIEVDELRRAAVQELGRDRVADAEALGTFGIDLDEVRERIEETFGPGALDRPVSDTSSCRSIDDGPRPWERRGRLPFTPRAKKVLELALREARHLGHGYLGTEHLLLGMVREREGVAAEILLKAGATPERVRHAVIEELSHRIDPPGASA
jgi:ATP-dependent Clp protease ATP-binding subunit ClpA